LNKKIKQNYFDNEKCSFSKFLVTIKQLLRDISRDLTIFPEKLVPNKKMIEISKTLKAPILLQNEKVNTYLFLRKGRDEKKIDKRIKQYTIKEPTTFMKYLHKKYYFWHFSSNDKILEILCFLKLETRQV
jgi:hypothetical protein